MTKESFEILKQRLSQARKDDAALIIEIEEARKQGDLSENADYSAAMDKKKNNDALIARLTAQINSAVIVEDVPTDTSKVSINTVVTIKVMSGKNVNQERTYKIGDSINTDPDNGIISEQSPLGKAMKGHGIGDVVLVETKIPYSIKIISIK